MGENVRPARAKLVREGVYNPRSAYSWQFFSWHHEKNSTHPTV